MFTIYIQINNLYIRIYGMHPDVYFRSGSYYMSGQYLEL